MVLLALLAEAPMHPYRMQQLIRQRRKDTVVNVGTRASIYQTIERLLRDELIAVHAVDRDGARPERTGYRLTEAGGRTLHAWLDDMLAVPAAEYPAFPAALAFLPLLAPRHVAELLERRAAAVRAALAEIDPAAVDLPRLFLVEDSYRHTMLTAELAWLDEHVADLRTGALTWDPERLRRASHHHA